MNDQVAGNIVIATSRSLDRYLDFVIVTLEDQLLNAATEIAAYFDFIARPVVVLPTMATNSFWRLRHWVRPFL